MPTTNPFDMSRNVRNRAWTFSKVRSWQARWAREPARRGTIRRSGRGSRCRTGRGPSPERPAARALMSIVSAETPRCSIRATALVRVRSVVPKPGIVRPWTSRRSRPSMSQVVTATKSASVESRPPEMPMIERRGRRGAVRSVWPAPRTGCRRSRRTGGAARAHRAARTACPAPRASGRPWSRRAAKGTRRNGFTSDQASSKLVVTRRSVMQLGDVDVLGDRVRVAATAGRRRPGATRPAAGRSRRSGSGRRRPRRSSIPTARQPAIA